MNKKGLIAVLVVLGLAAAGYAAYFIPKKIVKNQIDTVVAGLADNGLNVKYEDFKYDIFKGNVVVENVVLNTKTGVHKFKEVAVVGANQDAVKRVNDPSYYPETPSMKTNPYYKAADVILLKGYESDKRQISSIVIKEPSLRQLSVIPTAAKVKSFSSSQVVGLFLDTLKISEIQIKGVKGKAYNDSVDEIVISNLSGEGIDVISVRNGSVYNNLGAKTGYESIDVKGLKYASSVKASAENLTKVTTFDEVGGIQVKKLELSGPDNSVTYVDSIDVKKVVMENGVPMNVDIKISKIEPDIKTMNDQVKAVLSLLGYDALVMDFSMEFNTKKTGDSYSFTMDEVALSAKDLGQIMFGFNVIGNMNVAGLRQGTPDVNTMKLTGIRLRFADDSFMNRFMNMQAQTTGMREDALRENMKRSLDAIFENKRHLAQYRVAIMDFIDNPKVIEMAAFPKEPVLVNEIMGYLMKQDVPALIKLLNVTVSSNKL
ncbi:MAG: hypothetical protein GY804_07505 [Alphaproteobacteria bacterium]|nr:hypothetical protein [Alphaproteobacteria bacterium]